nr:hypothetical protein [Fredinandcohnia onubensis]
MKKTLCITLLFLLFHTISANALSWAYFFVVHDGKVYEAKEEVLLKQTELGKEIGKVETKADEYSGDYYGNASNYYEIGTRYYKIQGVPITESIAVETEVGQYVKAVYVHDAPPHIKNILTSSYFGVIFGIGIVLLVGITVLKSKQS